MNPALKFSDVPLTRPADLRGDADWLVARLKREDTRVIPVWRDLNLIEDREAIGGGEATARPSAVICGGPAAADVLAASGEVVFLGMEDRRAVFAADLSDACEGDAAAAAGSRGTFQDLWRAGPSIDTRGAALMAYARGMLYWHRQNRHCGRCGHHTESREGGHRRRCMRQGCGGSLFPRIDPAVITLVEYRPDGGAPPMCLLGNHHRPPPNVFSTLSGYAEPGESLEETVAREVFEEVGVRVQSAYYQASQPWPFPSSLMLGFRARAETTRIKVSPDELADARWFTAEEVKSFGEWGDESVAHALPRRDSIARFLVDSWVSEVSAH